MNSVESDLEEGEIIDDSPSSPCSNNSDKKTRELPKRYIVHKKPSPFHKHKKDCKYGKHAIRYHAKKLSKLKKSPKSRDSYKKHHKSTCPHEKSRRPSDNSSTNVGKNFSQKSLFFTKHSLIAEIKESVKDYSIKEQSAKHLSKPNKNISLAEKGNIIKNIKNDDSKSEIDREKENVHSENISICNVNKGNQASKNSNDSSNEIEIIEIIDSDNDAKVCCNTATSPKSNHEESEDEEELRRIALATFAAKKKAVAENSTETSSVSEPNFANVAVPCNEVNSPASDNYEVVDMEVDEDIQSQIEILDNSEKSQSSEVFEELFVIDNKPSENFKENNMPGLHNSSDDDFETDILRAELIESLYRRKGLKDEHREEKEKPNMDVQEKQMPVKLPEKKNLGKYKKLNPNFYRKQLQHGKQVLRKNVGNKVQNLLCKIKNKPENLLNNPYDINNKQPNVKNKPPIPLQMVKSSERLVIALNDESSSDDSSDSESENPVASIEALISDCRQKSDSCEKIEEVPANVPKNVSCLSKAQQQEYTSLKKILDQKKLQEASESNKNGSHKEDCVLTTKNSDKIEKLQEPTSSPQSNKNGSVCSPLDELKLMERKLSEFEEDLKKKKKLMIYLSKEINAKKLLYMKSKLTAQQLKEQYLAAEKIRKANLSAWSKSCSDFKSVRKTVSILENKINNLQSLCSKVQGQAYILSSLSTNR